MSRKDIEEFKLWLRRPGKMTYSPWDQRRYSNGAELLLGVVIWVMIIVGIIHFVRRW